MRRILGRLTNSSEFCFRLFLFPVVLLLGTAIRGVAQPFPGSPEPWREAYNISLGGFEFSHPMTVINRAELIQMKRRVADHVEPQKSAYRILMSEAASQLEFVPDPPVSMHIMGGYELNSNLGEMRDRLWQNCHAAYTCALAYAYSEETVYADKAVEVLMRWAYKETVFSGHDSGLQLGSWFSPMLYAADLLYEYSGWLETDRLRFQNWWRLNCLVDGDVLDVMRRRDNNWKDAGLLGVMCAAVVLEDTLLLKEALIQVKSYFFSRTDAYVELPGPGWKIKRDEYGVYLPREVVRNDGESGLTYTAYALTSLVQCLEIARYAGFDFWRMQTESGAGMADVIHQYFAWDKNDEGFPWHDSPIKSNKRQNCYELANALLEVEPDLTQWVEKNWPVVSGREGDEYCSLNKGDLSGSGIIPPAAPEGLTATAVSESRIDLAWRDNSVNEAGFVIERRTGASAYTYLTNVNSNEIFFSDTLNLSAGTTYTYRIKAFFESASSTYSNEATATTLKGKDDYRKSVMSPDGRLVLSYPNPFSSATRVEYSVDSVHEISLVVFTLSGRLVRVLVKGRKPAGRHDVEWDGRDERGIRVSNGLYVVKLRDGEKLRAHCVMRIE